MGIDVATGGADGVGLVEPPTHALTTAAISNVPVTRSLVHLSSPRTHR